MDSSSGPILPVFYGDNYVSLMPGERRALLTKVSMLLNQL
jgi:hypothetical protein